MNIRFGFRWLIPPLLFIFVALLYFSPVLQGKKIFQSDIKQYIGMSKAQNDYHKATGKETYWTDSAFGGMPTYQLGAHYPNNYIKKVDSLIRFLPRPADYLFLCFISFYILMLVLKVDYRMATIGALGFGLSTYFIIILGVGHNAKAHAIGYFPLVLAGMMLIFRNNRQFVGFLLMTLSIALEISANHYQMTYYLMLLILIFGILEFVASTKHKNYIPFFKNVGVALLSTILAMMLNATSLMATKEYAKWSTRGNSSLTIGHDGSPKEKHSGLDRDYITQYSYGIFESLNLFVPRLVGGSNSEDVGQDSHTYKMLLNRGVPPRQAIDLVKNLPTYWGKQPFVAGPAYVGTVIVFLFILSFFLIKGRFKRFLLLGIILSLLLSWGKNFSGLTNLMIDYFPMYNKFRAVSSIQVLLELCVPILSVMGLQAFFDKKTSNKGRINALKKTSIIMTGILILLLVIKGTFDFSGISDEAYKQYFGEDVMRMIRLDREVMYSKDIWRSLIFVILSAGVLWLFIKQKISLFRSIIGIALFIVSDLWMVDKRYVNDDDFIGNHYKMNFQPTNTDKQILRDTAHYRVWEPALGNQGARTSYFHKSIGGYHAAKPQRMQDVFDHILSKSHTRVLNMLNVKYVIQEDKAHLNEDNNGNAWFVRYLKVVDTEDEELAAIDTLLTKTMAVVSSRKKLQNVPNYFEKDSTAYIHLKQYQPNRLIYESSNIYSGLAIFSEMYYPQGWKVRIDGKPAKHFRANYLLRAMLIPPGKHEIIFAFEPKVVVSGSRIVLGSSLLFLLLLGGGVFLKIRNHREEINSKEV